MRAPCVKNQEPVGHDQQLKMELKNYNQQKNIKLLKVQTHDYRMQILTKYRKRYTLYKKKENKKRKPFQTRL